MKQQCQGLLIVFLFFLMHLSALALPKINHKVPDFTVVDTYGKAHQLSNYHGKLIVLEWTNHLCPFVKKHYESGNMQSLQKEFTDRGVIWLSVISSGKGQQGYITNQQANTLTEKRRAHPTAVIRDPKGQLGHLMGAKTTPHLFVLDKTGKLVYTGAIDSLRSTDPGDIKQAKPYLSMVLNDLLAGRSIKIQVTKPYGCSIKYVS